MRDGTHSDRIRIARISQVGWWLTIGCLLLPSLSACMDAAQLDPDLKPYVWHPTGANEANIAAMVKTPGDLALGRGSLMSPAGPQALAIARVQTDQPKRLVGAGGGGGAEGGGGGGGGGAGGGAAGGN